jgi:nucleoid DNA-binding protein
MPLYLITQGEMIADLAEKTGFPKGEVKHMLHALEEYIAAEVAKGNRVKVAGVLVEPKLKKAVKFKKNGARNPQTGEQVDRKAKPAKVVLKAKIASPLSKAKLPSVKKFESF